MVAPTFPGWHITEKHKPGGQGQTYLVRRDSEDTPVFLAKTLHKNTPKKLKRFAREVQALKEIRHENVIRLEDENLENDPPFLVVEYVDGGSLYSNKDVILQYSPERKLELFLDICRGIAATHEASIIHRDIKPKNLLMTLEGVAKIGDYGIAFITDMERLTDTDESVGARYYIAPELVEGRAEINSTCDIYSLGKVLYWLFSGKDFEGQDHLIRERNIVLLNNDPLLTAVNNVIGNAIALRPLDRYQSSENLIEAIEGARDAIQKGIPDMDSVFHAYYAASRTVLLLSEYFDSDWIASESTGKLRSTLQKVLRKWNDERYEVESVVDDYYLRSIRRVMEKIANMQRAQRDHLTYIGNVELPKALKDLKEYFQLSDTAYAEALRGYRRDQSSAEQVYLSSPLAQLDPVVIEDLRQKLEI